MINGGTGGMSAIDEDGMIAARMKMAGLDPPEDLRHLLHGEMRGLGRLVAVLREMSLEREESASVFHLPAG